MIYRYTVSDFYNAHKKDLKILAGEGGMSRVIIDTGVLDYEIDPDVKDRYFHTNFHENQLALTTFSCVRNNPHLVTDAIKHLISKGISGLVIKNVFNIPVSTFALRYADTNHFPILSIESHDIYMDEITYEVFKNTDYSQKIRQNRNVIDTMFSQQLTPDSVKNYARQINPSFSDQYRCIFVKIQEFTSYSIFNKYYEQFIGSILDMPENMILPYEDGFFLVISRASRISDSDAISCIVKDKDFSGCGTSSEHFSLKEFDIALQESLYAARMAGVGQTVSYDSLGTRRLIFPYAQTPTFRQFADNTLAPVIDYDIEHNSNLLDTLSAYIDAECNIDSVSETLSMHKNTVRYRLERVSALTGLDYKLFSNLEQLSIALKILQLR